MPAQSGPMAGTVRVVVIMWIRPLASRDRHGMSGRQIRFHGSEVDVAEEGGGILGGDRVDVEARAPLEAGDLREPGDDLDVPMIVGQLLVVERRGVDDVVVRGVV